MQLVDPEKFCEIANHFQKANGFYDAYDINLALERSFVEAEPIKHGHWWHYEGTLTCSVCHTEIYDDIMDLLGDDVPRYCPNCGADMQCQRSENDI